MARFDAPVMNTSLRAPASSASSTAYWMRGLSTTGSISLGMALVAGRNRVPRPATGNTALRIGFIRCRQNGRRPTGRCEQLSWVVFLGVRFLAKLIVQIETGHLLGTGAQRDPHD